MQYIFSTSIWISC